MSFLSRAWRNGLFLWVVGILREWMVRKIYGHLEIVVRRRMLLLLRWWWRQSRKVIPEEGRIDGREEFIGIKGGREDGGGR